MAKEYYYLISSLKDLAVDVETGVTPIREFMEFCAEQLTDKDFDDLKRMFFFNDIQNAIKYNSDQDQFFYPAYYDKEEYLENLKDTDRFIPFLAEFFYNKKIEKRLFAEITLMDELVWIFYQHVDEEKNQFVRDYYNFELNLRNINNAITMRGLNGTIADKIIKHGDYLENILKSSAPDFGVSGEFTYIDQLISAHNSGDVIKIEKVIDDIRWRWLDERVGLESFGAEFVFAYAVKLNSIQRWINVSSEKGRSVLDGLVNKIRESVKFSEEFIAVGGKK